MRIDLEDLAALSGDVDDALLLLGLADEPELQRQHPVGVRVEHRGLLVVGSGGSGKSTALRTLAAQAGPRVVRVPATAEGAWDAVAELTERVVTTRTVVVIDDLDALTAALPPDHARELLERLERLVRGAGAAETLVLVSVQRLSGGAARVAELLPRRLVLATSSRSEHIAAGGDSAHYTPGSPPGRGRLDGRAVQVAMSARPEPRVIDEPAPWHPSSGSLTGFVLRRSPISRMALTEWEAAGARVLSLDDYAGTAEWGSTGPVVVAGDVEEWQRHWRALTAIRADHDLVVDASCGPEFRLVTGERGLPPYCDPGRARAWLLSAGGAPVRIALPTPRT